MVIRTRVAFAILLTMLFFMQIWIYFYGSSTNTLTDVWKRKTDNCVCDKSSNCYTHPNDQNLCGKCFLCNKHMQHRGDPIKDVAIGISSNELQISRLLVLIGSIHSHYPHRKILIYNNFMSPKTNLKKQLISIRNVEVVETFDVPGLLSSQPLNNIAFTPFFIQNALTRYENVLWLYDCMEFLSKGLDLTLNQSTGDVTYLGRQSTTAYTFLGFSPFFPSRSFTPRNYTALYFQQRSWDVVNWLAKCAGTTTCYDCRDSTGLSIDCLPFLIARLSSEYKVEFRSIPPKSLEIQSWAPPSCDLTCIISTAATVLACLILLIGGILLYFNKCIQKQKK